MNLKVLGTNLLVEIEEAKKKTEGGLHIPDSAQEKQAKGVVKAIGDGRIDSNGKVHPLSVKVGDVVMFKEFTGSFLGDNDESIVVIKEDDVLVIVDKD